MFGNDCYCFYCDFTGKPGASSGCFDSDSTANLYKMHFEDQVSQFYKLYFMDIVQKRFHDKTLIEKQECFIKTH